MVKKTGTLKKKGKETILLPEVPRNEKGGVLVTEEEIEAAFKFFDTDKNNCITSANLKDRLKIFNENLTNREIKQILQGKNSITLNDLKDLLLQNDVKDFDPYSEAFQFYDPNGTGFIDVDIIRNVFKLLGHGDIDDEEMNALIDVVDKDKDGKINLDDFRSMQLPDNLSSLKITSFMDND